MSATKTSAQAQEPEKSLSDIFNPYVRETAERFPEMKGRLVIMDVKTRLAYGIDDIDFEKISLTKPQLLDCLARHEITSSLTAHPEGSSQAFREPDSGLNIIFFNERVDKDAFNKVAKKEIPRLKRLLDHEASHLGIEDGYYTETMTPEQRLGEGVADAHTLMLHYQRSGTDKECVDKYVSPFSRADRMIFNDDDGHFTSFVLEEIIKCRNAIDFANLDPARTAGIARHFARQYTPATETVEELRRAFYPVWAAWHGPGNDADTALQKLIEVTLDPKSSYAVFRTGNIWLQKYVADKITFPAAPMSKEDKQALSRKLKEREYHFSHGSTKPARRRAPPQEWKKLGLGN